MSDAKKPRAALALVALFAPLLAPLFSVAPASAQAVVSTGESFAEVSFLPGRAEPGGGRLAGLVIDLAPEWKTYWRSPGAAGVPPSFDWSGSENLASAEVLWPRPRFFESFGIETLGYARRVVFPLRLVPADPAKPIGLRLALSFGVCREICVLEETALAETIAPDAPETGAPAVAAAEASVPRPATALGLTEARCRIAGAGKTRSFEATLAFDRPPGNALADAAVVLEGPELVFFGDVRTTPAPGTGRLRVEAEISLLDERAWIGRSDIRMTVLAPDFAADVRGCDAASG